MSRYSEEALESALTQLTNHAASGKARSNWTSTFLTAARMAKAGYSRTSSGADSAVTDLFKLIPNNARGRINPFINLTSKMRWLQVRDSGRKTVWNNATRGNPQAPLFINDHIENGLRSTAIDVLLESLGTEEPLPARDALAVLLTRERDWPAEPAREDLHRAASDFLGLSQLDFDRITADEPLDVPVMGADEWSPEKLEAWAYGPPRLEVVQPPAGVAVQEEAPVASVHELHDQFRRFLGSHGISAGSHEETLDLLAATLSSQLLVMAGPSGSGKSLMAAALSSFFASKGRRRKLEATRLLARREEFFGYYSHLAGQKFMAYDQLLELLELSSDSAITTSPVLTIEEANLSPIEGYLSPLVHGLSGLETETLVMPLHSQPADVESQVPNVSVPPKLMLRPYPRFFATINVDADSPAPARKVVSRSCVVLLETPSVDTTLSAADTLVQPSVEDARGQAAGLLGRPTLAYERYTELGGDLYQQAMKARAELLRDEVGTDVISPRAFLKSLMYIAWYLELSGIEDPDLGEPAIEAAADNALLHFVLPSLPASQFASALTVLSTGQRHGVLAGRVARLQTAMAAQQFGPPPDFWGALS